jgi:hypothetical protein
LREERAERRWWWIVGWRQGESCAHIPSNKIRRPVEARALDSMETENNRIITNANWVYTNSQ